MKGWAALEKEHAIEQYEAHLCTKVAGGATPVACARGIS